VVTCRTHGDFKSIDPDAALCLYRIAQEALHNVVNHAGASRAEVHLRLVGNNAEITIADNGKGFDLQKQRTDAGLGLVGITERARLAGGTFTLVTAPNEGTHVRVQVPINGRTTTTTGDTPPFRGSSDRHQ
jgi:signal transduction histidine kinase